MLILENIFLALNSLKANKARAILTMIGIIIGITSVITIMTIGSAMTAAMTEKLSSRGANVITIGVSSKEDEEEESWGPPSAFDIQRGMTANDYLSYERIAKIEDNFKDRIEGISLTENVGSTVVKSADKYANLQLQGINSMGIKETDLKLLSGRVFYKEDYTEGRKVCLVSDRFCDNLYNSDTESVLGETISVVLNNKYYSYNVVGVYKYESNFFDFSTSEYDTTTNLYIPLETALSQTHNKKGFGTIKVLAASVDDATKLGEDIEAYTNRKFYRNNEFFEVTSFCMQSVIEEVQDSLGQLSLVVSAVAGISLLVGGIGVMNIMLVSVTERTKEIGTRKALGATNGSIRIQFIVESIVLCLLGGIIGIILGTVFGMGISKIMGYPAATSLESMILSVGFSTFIGISFGFYPANKAAKMNPIDALRFE